MNDQRTLREETGKDPETLEREIKQTRADMNVTLDSLEQKLTAGQLLDQCLKFFGRTGSEIGSSLGQCIKENPMPALLTATGIAWMMSGSRQDRSVTRYRYYPDEGSDPTDPDQHTGEGTLSKIGDKLQSGAASARSQLASSKDSAKETLNTTLNKTTESVRETVNRTTSAAQAQARRAREGFNSLLEEQPLVLGAIGVALGAAIGAAIPSTEQEDRLVGEMRDKTLTKAKELGAQSYEKGRETAKQAVDSAVKTISDKPDESSTVHS
jgi:ElaB/YqjD/DUF883 family membrane-anchored ribosome-binding protein